MTQLSQALSFIHLLNPPGGVKPPMGKKGSKSGLKGTLYNGNIFCLLILEPFLPTTAAVQLGTALSV